MADRPSLLDYGAWSSETKMIAGVAAIVAFVLFLLLDAGWLIALIIAILAFLAVVWWRQRAADEPMGSARSQPLAPDAPPHPGAPAAPLHRAAPQAAAPEPRPSPAAAPASAAPLMDPAPAAPVMDPAPDAPPDADPLAVASSATLGASRPAALDAPREGRPDDLKRIKGVGPKLEELLHSLGVYHFDQIASWGPSELAWIDSNLEGFNGRASRDDWIGQSKVLAAGGETDHSQRVDRGLST